MDKKTLLKTRHAEYIQEARELLQRLAQKLDEEAVLTDFNWGDVGWVCDLVDRLRDLGPDWVGDKAHDDF